CPDGEHGGLFRHVPPLLGDVIDVELRDGWDSGGGAARKPFAVRAGSDFAFSGKGGAQSRIAHDQSGGGGLEHLHRNRGGFEKFRGDLPAAIAEDSDEGLGAAGAAVQGNLARLTNRHLGDNQEAADALFGGDGEVGKNRQASNALVLDGGDDCDVGGAGAQGF